MVGFEPQDEQETTLYRIAHADTLALDFELFAKAGKENVMMPSQRWLVIVDH